MGQEPEPSGIHENQWLARQLSFLHARFGKLDACFPYFSRAMAFATDVILKAILMAAASAHPPSTVNESDVAGAISSYYGVSSGNSAVTKLLQVIFPEVASAASRDPGSWKSVFPSVLAKYENMAKDLGLGVSQQQREIDAARNANPTAAGFKSSEFGQLAARFLSNGPLAIRDDGDARRGGERPSGAAITHDTPLSVNGAIGYAREIGANPALAGFFVGGSPEMRDALRGAIHNGTAITDDKVKNMRDVSMVIGAVRAGKLKPDDPNIPPSVRQIIEDMKKQGIDPATADPKKVKKYLDDHPGALKAAKKESDARLKSKAGQTDDQIEASLAAKLRGKLAGSANSTGTSPAQDPHTPKSKSPEP
jgi:hypothetical protein